MSALGVVEGGLKLIAGIVMAAKKPPEVVKANAQQRAVRELANVRSIIRSNPEMPRRRRLRLASIEAGWVAWLRAAGLDDFGRPLPEPEPVLDPQVLIDLAIACYDEGYEDAASGKPQDGAGSEHVEAIEQALKLAGAG